MNKAEDQQFAILISELNSEREERRKIQKKFELLEKKNSALEAKNEQVQQERDGKRPISQTIYAQLALLCLITYKLKQHNLETYSK